MRRLFGAMLLVPVVAMVWFDQMIAGLVLVALGGLMGAEVKRIAGLSLPIGLFVLGLIIVQSFPQWLIALPPIMALALGCLAAILIGIYSNRLAMIFVGLLCLCLASASLLVAQPSGHVMLVALAAIIAACDSAAYFVGRQVGGPKLWPQVSPNKTISGSLGGLVAAMLVTALLANFLGIDNGLEALFVGVVIGGLAQAGDLLESAVKRSLDVKDSGSILPGHGGMLDRFDGYIFVVPAVYIYVFGV